MLLSMVSSSSTRSSTRVQRLSATLVLLAACDRGPAPSVRSAVDATSIALPIEASTASVINAPTLDAAVADAPMDVWEDAGPPVVVGAHPVILSLRDALFVNATPDLRYTLERVNINHTERGAGRAIYYALWDFALRTMLPAALYRPSDWRWPRARVVDDATLLAAASMYTDDAFTLDRAPSFDSRCLSDTCPREAERRADCNTRPLDFVRGYVDSTVSKLRMNSAALADGGSIADSESSRDAAIADADAGVADASWTDEDYCAESQTLITELTALTELRGDCRSAQSTSVALLHAIATTARRRVRPANVAAPFRDASSAVDQ